LIEFLIWEQEMSDQISYDDPIWDLTPTELLIAYWSLTLTKPEIASKANITEGTVGTHLTSIYTKLGLSELDDEVKRSLLDSRHGQALNRVVKEIDEEFTKYADKTKALQKKKSENAKSKKGAAVATATPGMQSPPPPPQSQPQTQLDNRLRGVPALYGLLLDF
jgi:DNA-binding CsgD family transcriptional regulator